MKKAARQTAVARQQARARTAVSVAKDQLGDPYRYGATGPGSFDCSGLVQYAWKKAGVKIPRVTNSQFARIKKKVSWKNLKPGDLLFFHGLGHVGMFVGNGKMIHSPRTGQTVRIEKLSGWRKASFAGAVRPGL
ncbi:C40 family peptidase [Nonomuraea sp. NPDC049141]|uniref:C40 family peptidase n=1 Tax=Nonomuraea sp. NPDC049141 TaxID=3155500 RepID=UPI003409F8B9